MVKEKRAQGALEFLMTYGWAFLVILVMIGALAYFGVLNPTRFLPDRCMFSTPPFSCKGQEYTIVDSTTNTVQIQLQNTFGRGVNVTNMSLNFTDFPTISCGNTWTFNGVNGASSIIDEGGLPYLNASCASGTLLEKGRKTKVLIRITWKEATATSPITKVTEGELYAQVQ